MKFATKILLSILIIAISACIVVTISIYSIFKNDIELEFADRYHAYGKTIASTFHHLEMASELANKNALLLLSKIEAKRGIPSDKELDALAKKFGVNGFYIIDKSGKFIRSQGFRFINCKTIYGYFWRQTNIIINIRKRHRGSSLFSNYNQTKMVD